MYLVHFEPVGDEHEHCSRETDWSEDGPGLYTSHPSRHIAHRPSSSGPHRHTSQASATPFYAGTGSCHVAAVAVVQAIMSPCHWARSQGRQTFFKKIDFLGFFYLNTSQSSQTYVMQSSPQTADMRHLILQKLQLNYLQVTSQILERACQSVAHFL